MELKAPSATLEVLESGGKRMTFEVPPEGIRIGRSPDCGIRLETNTVSKHHAEVFWRGGDLYVLDQDSCNGTRRDGVTLTGPTLLRNGDELVLGGSVVVEVEIQTDAFGQPVGNALGRGISTLVPSNVPIEPALASLDLLPAVTRLYQSVSEQELAFQLTRSAGALLQASRIALIELGEDGSRVRVLSLHKAAKLDARPLTDAGFVSRTVVEAARKHGIAHFREGTQDLSKSIMRSGAHSAAAAMVRARDRRERVLYVDCTLGEAPLGTNDVQTLNLLAAHAGGAFDALHARLTLTREQTRFEQLRRYFSPAVVEYIVDRQHVMDVPQNVQATVLFADLVGYTALSERLTDQPARLLSLLNRWLDEGAQAVIAHEGTLDKFIGDCVMAVFGAPLPQADAAMRAVRCGLAMRQAIQRVSFEEGERLQITVGINSGSMLAGSIGSKRRLEYTVLGDAVNVGSRLQGKAEAGEILIGQATYEQLEGAVQVADAGIQVLKNHGPVQAYRVLSMA
jgi:adenylate cyclase